MTRTPLVALCGLLVGIPLTAAAQSSNGSATQVSPQPQGTGAPKNGATPPPATPDTTLFGSPNSAAPAPQAAVPPAMPQTPPAAAANTGASKTGAKPGPSTGALRNGFAVEPTALAPNGPASQPGSPSTVTYGGPQPDLQPVYGSPMRDPGTARNGTPVYNNAPLMPGGSIKGTANAYAPTQPYGSATPGSTNQASRGEASDDGSTYNLQPLGGVPKTRDQFGTYGGRAGYNASGVYNGTAAQSGVGYGSAYAPSGRVQGGLLSTNVDATGPLRPYIPLNQGPQGRPNSGYGTPNGSRATHMDGRGVQRLN